MLAMLAVAATGSSVLRVVRGAFFLLAAGSLLVACGPEEPGSDGGAGPQVRLMRAEVGRIESPEATEEQVAHLVRGNNAFAFGLYHAGSEEGNLIFSPYSISLAFSMAYAGARGETEEQMADVLHFLPQGAQHPTFNLLEKRMSGLGGVKGSAEKAVPFRLNVANAAWGQRGYRFEEAYLKTLAGHYGAGLRTLDFGQPKKASEEINAWISEQTEERIEDLVSPEILDASTRLVLANAVYFKASWLYRFEEGNRQDRPFTLPDGSKTTVPMMRQAADLLYTEGDGYQAVQLPYKGDKVDMLVLLPDAGRFEQLESELDAGFFEGVSDRLEPRYVELTMPRFDFETDLDLRKLLQRMGMIDPFDLDAANFSGITGSRDLYISDALHRANITVDEEGTEAAAATVLVIQPTSGRPRPLKMGVDRPFIFAIVERETGGVMFLGRVTNPSG